MPGCRGVGSEATEKACKSCTLIGRSPRDAAGASGATIGTNRTEGGSRRFSSGKTAHRGRRIVSTPERLLTSPGSAGVDAGTTAQAVGTVGADAGEGAHTSRYCRCWCRYDCSYPPGRSVSAPVRLLTLPGRLVSTSGPLLTPSGRLVSLPRRLRTPLSRLPGTLSRLRPRRLRVPSSEPGCGRAVLVEVVLAEHRRHAGGEGGVSWVYN